MVESLCPDGWISHGGGCYAFVTNMKFTWNNAGVMLKILHIMEIYFVICHNYKCIISIIMLSGDKSIKDI